MAHAKNARTLQAQGEKLAVRGTRPDGTSAELRLSRSKDGSVTLKVSGDEEGIALQGEALQKLAEFLAQDAESMRRFKPNKLLTSHEVAELIQMDPSSVVKWVNDGLLRAFTTPGGHRRIQAEELHRFMKEHGMAVTFELVSEQ